jgi:hypothetical protein
VKHSATKNFIKNKNRKIANKWRINHNIFVTKIVKNYTAGVGQGKSSMPQCSESHALYQGTPFWWPSTLSGCIDLSLFLLNVNK